MTKLLEKESNEINTGKYRQKLEETCLQISDFRKNLCSFTKFLQQVSDDQISHNQLDINWKNPSTRTPRRM